jgi:hypothetical protein
VGFTTYRDPTIRKIAVNPSGQSRGIASAAVQILQTPGEKVYRLLNRDKK